jgi:hypothetical protein
MRSTFAFAAAVPAAVWCVIALAGDPSSRPSAAGLPAAAPTTRGAAAAPPVAAPPIVTREQWGSRPQPIPDARRHTPAFITLHHAGVDWRAGTDPAAFVRNLQAWGQRRARENADLPPAQRRPGVTDWPDIPYHYLIAPDGRIFEARPTGYEPESNTTYDLRGHLGVELMGNFQTQRPTVAQLRSTVALVAWLCQEHHIAADQIAGHKDRARGQTSCPGRDFDRYLVDGQFVAWVRRTLAGEVPDVRPGPPLPGGPTVPVDEKPPANRPATRPGP